jgi:hypothetical protein
LSQSIAEALQRNEIAVDPSIAPRDGVGSLRLAGLVVDAQGDFPPGALWTAGPEAGDLMLDAATLTRDTGDLTASAAPRADLASVGVFTEAHVKAAAEASRQTGQPVASILNQVVQAAPHAPGASHFALQRAAPGESQRLVAIERSEEGAVSIFDFNSGVRRPLVNAEPSVVENVSVLAEMIAQTPRSALLAGSHSARVVSRGGRSAFHFTIRENRFASSPQAEVREMADFLNVLFPSPDIEVEGDLAPQSERLFDFVMPAPLRDAAVVASVSTAMSQLAAASPAAPPAAFIQADLRAAPGGLAASALASIQPAQTFRARLSSMVSVPDWIRPPDADVFESIVPAPSFAVAFAELFARTAPDRFLPPDLDLPQESITVLRTNPRFVGAFMVGANHEMNRELIWRTYPSDGRGTPAKRFWKWYDPERRDVDAIHAWPAAGPLVERVRSGIPLIVLVIRGRLLRRYPNTLVLAWKAEARGKLAALPANPNDRRQVLREPLFRMLVEPDIGLVGFDLTVEQFTSAADPAGWYVVLQEPITEPRFGLDEPGTPVSRRRSINDLNWMDTGIAVGGHLSTGGVLAGSPTSADIAAMLLQRPVRVAIHSTQLAPALEGWRSVS